ncbi:zinc finger C3HC-type protein 1-like isoform X2 [Rhopilema esculentum]
MTCNPGSKDMFIERVKSFSPSTWTAKPVELSPLHCSRYGWMNGDNDELVCVTCKAALNAGLPDNWDNETYTEMCKSIQEKLKKGHKDVCPWQASPCPVSFLSLPNHSRDGWHSYLRNAFEKLLTLGKDMPLLDEDVLDKMGIAERGVIQELLNIVNHQSTNDEQNLFARTAVALALCGWKPSEQVNDDATLLCDTCLKECGLWNFVSVTEENNPVRAGKRFATEQGKMGVDTRSMYASFLSDVSTFRSAEFVSSNVSMHSETDSQMSENGMNATGASDNRRNVVPPQGESRATVSVSSEAGEQARPRDSLGSTSEVTAEEGSDESVSQKSERKLHRSGSQESRTFAHIFMEPTAPDTGKMELMKALLFAKDLQFDPSYSESVISEVGSEAFEKRIEIAREEMSAEENTQDPDPPPPPPPNQENLMKELLLVTAPHEGSPRGSESIFSEVGSLMFDKRLETWSVCSPRAETPTMKDRSQVQEEESPVRTSSLEGRVKRMRFHEPGLHTFNVVEEHRHWCPWLVNGETKSSEGGKEPLPGWKGVLNSLLNNDNRTDKLLQGSPDEVWKSVRRVLKDCQSPKLDPADSGKSRDDSPQ